jgi:hypothetical protein
MKILSEKRREFSQIDEWDGFYYLVTFSSSNDKEDYV